MTLAIAHRQRQDGNIVVLDCLREVRPPFSPIDVVNEFAQVCQSYRVARIYGDRFAGEWCRQPFRESGVAYEISAQSKTDLYLNFLPQLNAGRVRLLDHQRLIGQLSSLERRVTRGTGRDVIDHPSRAHDDCANCVAGVVSVAKRGTYDASLSWVSGGEADADAAAKEFQAARYRQHLLYHSGYFHQLRRW